MAAGGSSPKHPANMDDSGERTSETNGEKNGQNAGISADRGGQDESGEPSAKKVKLDVMVPEDYQEEDEEFPQDWKEMATAEDDDDDEGFAISLDEVKPRIDFRKALLNKKNIDFNEIPEINGVPVNEFNIDTLEEKPWKKPGADTSDYFNYGFNEETWRLYCDKQRRMRTEAQNLEATALQISASNKNDKFLGSRPGDQQGNVPFRAQFRRRNPDNLSSNQIQVLNDRKVESGGGVNMMPPMMMPGPGMPFGMPPPGMMGGPGMMGPPMMMRPMGDVSSQQRNQNFQPNQSFGASVRRQLTSINLSSGNDGKDS